MKKKGRILFCIAAFIVIGLPVIVSRGQDLESIILIKTSNTGRLVATASLNKELHIRDLATMNIIRSLNGYTGYPTAIAWTKDDSRLAIGVTYYNDVTKHEESIIYIYDTSSWELLFTSSTQQGWLYAIIWNATEINFISATEEIDGGETRVTSLDNSISPETIGGPTFALAISRDESQIVIGTLGGGIILRDARSYTRLLVSPRVSENIQPIFYLDWHSSLPLIASGHMDGMIRIWDATSGNTLHVLSAASAIGMDAEYSQMVLALAFDSTGTRLRSFNREGRIRVWDTQTWALIAEQIVPGPIYAADWDKTGTTLYYGTDSAIPRVVRAPDLPSPPPTPTALPHPIVPPPGGGQPACPGGGGEWMWVDGELVFVCGVSWE